MKSDHGSASAAKGYRHDRREGSSRKSGANGSPAWQRYAQPPPVGYGLGMLPPARETEPHPSGPGEDAAHRGAMGANDIKGLRDAFARTVGALRPEEATCRALADHLRIDMDCARTIRRIEYHLDALRRTAQFEVEALSSTAADSGKEDGMGYAHALLRVAQSWWMAHRREPGACSRQARLSVEAVYVARLIRKMMEVEKGDA